MWAWEGIQSNVDPVPSSTVAAIPLIVIVSSIRWRGHSKDFVPVETRRNLLDKLARAEDLIVTQNRIRMFVIALLDQLLL